MTESGLTGKRLILMRHGQRGDRDRAGKQVIDIARQLLEQGIEVDGIVHSPVARTTFAAQTLHAVLSPALAEHFVGKADPDREISTPEIEEAQWLHVDRQHDNVYDRLDDLPNLNDNHDTIILVTHEPIARAMYEEFTGEPEGGGKGTTWSRLARTVIMDLNITSWKDLEMYPEELKQKTVLEPQNSHYDDEPNKTVEAALEV